MNDFELESKLKSVRVPERTPEYWEDFPSHVRVQLRPGWAERAPRKTFGARLAWSISLAAACLLFGLLLWPSIRVVSENGKALRHELAQLPHTLRVVMADEHGMHYLIADQP